MTPISIRLLATNSAVGRGAVRSNRRQASIGVLDAEIAVADQLRHRIDPLPAERFPVARKALAADILMRNARHHADAPMAECEQMRYGELGRAAIVECEGVDAEPGAALSTATIFIRPRASRPSP